MGYGALIGGIISAVGSVAGSALSKSGGSQASSHATDAGKEIAAENRKYLQPFTGPGAWSLDLPGAVQESLTVGNQYAPSINQANQADLSAMLSSALPGWQGMVSQMGTNVSQQLSGTVPTDVQNQIQRFAAQAGITSGIGAGGGAGAAGAPFQLGVKGITARDLGLTSLSMMQQGQQGLSNLLSMSRNYLMPQPVSVQSVLPWSDIIAGQQYTQQAVFDANAAAFNAAAMGTTVGQLGQVPSQGSQVTGITSGIGGLLQGLGQKNPNNNQTGYSLLGNLFGGGGGNSLAGDTSSAFLAGAGGSSTGLTGFSGGNLAL